MDRDNEYLYFFFGNYGEERSEQAATVNAPFIEMFSPQLFESPLRSELAHPEAVIENGAIPLPSTPGLGVELVEETVEKYRVDMPGGRLGPVRERGRQ